MGGCNFTRFGHRINIRRLDMDHHLVLVSSEDGVTFARTYGSFQSALAGSLEMIDFIRDNTLRSAKLN